MTPFPMLFVLTTLLASSSSVFAKKASDIYDELKGSVAIVTIISGGIIKSSGSAVAVRKGVFVTNRHVVEDTLADDAILTTVMNVTRKATVKSCADDHAIDLCLIEVDSNDLKPVLMSSIRNITVGDRVYAIGAPKEIDRYRATYFAVGQETELTVSISEGIVSSLHDGVKGKIIQTTAPISPGSSGGGLFNENGELIGITTWKLVGGENMNMALPVNWVEDILLSSKEKKLIKSISYYQYAAILIAMLVLVALFVRYIFYVRRNPDGGLYCFADNNKYTLIFSLIAVMSVGLIGYLPKNISLSNIVPVDDSNKVSVTSIKDHLIDKSFKPYDKDKARENDLIDRSERMATYFRRGMYSEVIDEALSGDFLPDQYEILGVSFLHKKQYNNALITLAYAEKHSPSSISVKQNYANGLVGLGYFNLAIGKYQEILEIDPGNKYALGRIDYASSELSHVKTHRKLQIKQEGLGERDLNAILDKLAKNNR